MAQLEIRDLCKSFGTVKAVDKVSITINDGEMLCLLGPSGCGKTTLLRILSGFLEPDSGQVLMGGQDMTQLPPDQRPTSLVFQNYALFPHLNVFENIAFGLKIKKLPSAIINQKVTEMLDIVGLAGMEKRAISQMSGGQQQRVALGRALVMEPKVLLLDEPLSNLDAKLRVETRRQIRRIQQSMDITAVFVTHDQEEAMSMGDKIAILKSGALQQLGSPMELYRHPANQFVAGFLGTPAMNFFQAQAKAGEVWLGEYHFQNHEAPASGPCLLGVRPEDISLLPMQPGAPLVGRVNQVEPLGDHALTYLNYAEQTFCCRCNDFENLEEGQEVAFQFQLDRVKIFKETDKSEQ